MEDFFTERYNLLLKEWELANNNIGRIDTLIFIIRGWAMVLTSGIIAYAYTKNDALASLFSVIPLTGLWLTDALFKSFQRVFVRRSKKIEKYLASDQFKNDFEDRVPPPFPIPELSSGFGTGTFSDRVRQVFEAAIIRNVLLSYSLLIILVLLSYFAISWKP